MKDYMKNAAWSNTQLLLDKKSKFNSMNWCPTDTPVRFLLNTVLVFINVLYTVLVFINVLCTVLVFINVLYTVLVFINVLCTVLVFINVLWFS